MLVHHKSKHLYTPDHIFSPTITTTRTPLMEADFNLHKSNSTYFTDLDISRSYLAGALLGPIFLTGIDGRRCNLIVGSVACAFRKETKIYRACESWSRIASWDDKWIYVVTHFVSPRTPASHLDVLGPGAENHAAEKQRKPAQDKTDAFPERDIIASAVTQFVCKQGRKTVRPVYALAASGLFDQSTRPHSRCENGEPLLSDPGCNEALRTSGRTPELRTAVPTDIETRRRENLPVVRLEKGWEKLNELFKAGDVILGRHSSI